MKLPCWTRAWAATRFLRTGTHDTSAIAQGIRACVAMVRQREGIIQSRPNEQDPAKKACGLKQAKTESKSLAVAPVQRQGKRYAVLCHGTGAVRWNPHHLPGMGRSHSMPEMGFRLTQG